MVRTTALDADGHTGVVTNKARSTDVAPQPHVAAPTGRQAEAGGVSLIRQGLAERGFSQ